MKNKFIVVALIAVILAAGMVLVSCGGCPGDGKCGFKFADYDAGAKFCGTETGLSGKKLDTITQCAKDWTAAAYDGKDYDCTCGG